MKYHSEVFDKNGYFLPDLWNDWDGPKVPWSVRRRPALYGKKSKDV